MSKAYIGYDLGDGETITDITILDDQQAKTAISTMFIPMEMPDNNTPGEAIPTAYAFDNDGNIVFASSIVLDPDAYKEIRANFKRCPSDMVKKIDARREAELIELFGKGWPSSQQVPEVDFERLETFAAAVITFTDSIFNDVKYSTKVHDAIISCDSVTFCVGHPTRWNKLDVAIYRAILARSILGQGIYAGKPSQLILDAESRAAYLYVKNQPNISALSKGQNVLLIDIGSSTIDITATSSDSRDSLYNSGNNYLGVRSIDFLIRNWYLDKLREDPNDWEVYQELIRRNPSMETALTLSCRRAKEDVFSRQARRSRIIFADFAPLQISQEKVYELVSKKPIAPVLKETVGIPDDIVRALGNKTWLTLFREFVMDQKTTLEAKDIHVARIIITGSASKMPFAKEIIEDVFQNLGKEAILGDLNPSRSISMGLALVGPNDEKARKFREEVDVLIKKDVPDCIKNNIPELADSIATIVESLIKDIIRQRIREWKDGKFTTINQMSRAIETDCSEANLNKRLENDSAYKNAINHWAVNKVGQDIAVRLKKICDRYGVNDLSVDELNVLKIPKVDLNGAGSIPIDVISEVIAGVIAVIATIIIAIILPTVLVIVLNLVAIVSIDIAILLLDLLLLIPGPGWALLVLIVGIVIFNALKNGSGAAKRQATEKIKNYDLPSWARKLISDDKVNDKINQQNIKGKIKSGIMEKETAEKISQNISESLKGQIEARADDIKYRIK